MKNYRTGPETERLLMREFAVDDAQFVLDLNGNPDVMRFTHEPMLESIDQARERIRTYPDFDTVGFGRWGCVHKETGKLIGFCGLKYLSDVDQVDVGFRFLPEFWGQGFATEASRACVEFGFRELGLEKIIGLVLPENQASVRVLEKSGLVFDREIMDEGLRVLWYEIECE